jgi:hypothetical protein
MGEELGDDGGVVARWWRLGALNGGRRRWRLRATAAGSGGRRWGRCAARGRPGSGGVGSGGGGAVGRLRQREEETEKEGSSDRFKSLIFGGQG